jgi:hypothetical protein
MPPLLPVTASSVYICHNFLQVTVYTYERTKEDEAEQVFKKLTLKDYTVQRMFRAKTTCMRLFLYRARK